MVKQGKKLFAYIKMQEELDEEGTYAKFAYMGHDGLQRYEVTLIVCFSSWDEVMLSIWFLRLIIF